MGCKTQKNGGRTTTAPLGVQCSVFKILPILGFLLHKCVLSGTLQKRGEIKGNERKKS